MIVRIVVIVVTLIFVFDNKKVLKIQKNNSIIYKRQ